MRTFYWHSRVVGRLGLLQQRVRGRDTTRVFRTGNAGDIYNRDVIRATYGTEAENASEGGNRLLLIGSVAHNVQDGDVVCGVGTKGKPIPSAADVRCRVVAVRGPLTLDAFARAGHDVSGVVSQRDPGLLIRFAVPDAPAKRGRVAFLPHYRERDHYRGKLERGLTLIDIDDEPRRIARQIQAAELVYTSSLHGVIFSHALGRPAVLVAPLTEEPEIKYRDYFASVDLPWTPWRSLDEARRAASPVSPVDLRYTAEDFGLPSLAELRAAGIATPA